MIRQHNQSGFSAIEIGVVVLVVGIIGALGWKFYDAATNKPTVSNASELSNVDITSATLADLKDVTTIQAAALADKPGVTVVHVELEQSSAGALVYKAQLSDGTVTVYNARTGAHIRSTTATEKTSESLPAEFAGGIGFAKAVEIARAEKPGSKVYKIELELEGGVVVYSVRFTDKARVDVKASDGSVVRTKAARAAKATDATKADDHASSTGKENSTSGSSGSGSSKSDDNSGSSSHSSGSEDDSHHSSGHGSGSDDDHLSDSDDDDDSDDKDEDDGSSDDSGNSSSGKYR